MSEKHVGFIGLGIMGGPMAGHLLEAGHRLCMQTRTASKAAALVERGAELKATACEVAAACEVVMLCVPDTPDVEGVLFGAGGVVAGAKEGLIVVDHSTISPEATRGFSERLAERGVRLIDAPVSGGDVGAQRGTLSIMAGGDAEAFAAVEPLLGCYGTAVRVGESGAGQACKACNQLGGLRRSSGCARRWPWRGRRGSTWRR
ncbi:MAG: NAD(P)-dependent oxidoreductase [Planctomycetota bacterium]